jgi:hypothetical protein
VNLWNVSKYALGYWLMNHKVILWGDIAPHHVMMYKENISTVDSAYWEIDCIFWCFSCEMLMVLAVLIVSPFSYPKSY